MASKIMYLPLDERPCNYQYPKLILDISDYELLRPPFSLLGYKKQPADREQLWQWMKENVCQVSHLILSIDMFLYGGIVPSRLHNISFKEAGIFLDKLRELKQINSELKIYAYNLIMRVPDYDSADEEPDYYQDYGCRIFQYGVIQDKIDRGLVSGVEEDKFKELKAEIPEEFLADYLRRREINHQINLKAIQLLREQILDFLVIPLDDNAEYGFSAQERRKIMTYLQQFELMDKVYMYPGADEVASVLTARAFADITGHQSRVFVRYGSEKGKNLIPLLEDRPLSESVKYQIIAAGGILVDNSQTADYVLMINPPSELTLEVIDGWRSLLNRPKLDDPERNLNEFVETIDYYLGEEIPCAVADVAMVNGADPVLMILLKRYKILNKLLAYGGWNTSANTLGTVIAHAQIASYYIRNEQFTSWRKQLSEKFLYLRYLDDWAYQHQIRTEVNNQLPAYSLNYFDLSNRTEFIARLIKESLMEFSLNNIIGLDYKFDVYMPWNRMFEIGIKMD